MRGIRIILDKSVVYGLRNEEVDSLDRFFFQIVPPILIDEILADLAKETDPKTHTRISAHTYRVSGNHGLTLSCRVRLVNSLLGTEVPMDGRFLPSRETIVKTPKGSLATIVETPLEDEILARWERGEFAANEAAWAVQFREKADLPLDPEPYLQIIRNVGFVFDVPNTDQQLFAVVEALLTQPDIAPYFFRLLERDFGVPASVIAQSKERWKALGRNEFKEFAPYAFFCLKASFLWHLSLTNPNLFPLNKNDRKDLQYCYYLPATEVFASGDKKMLRLMSALVRDDQSLIDGEELKRDLRTIHESWEALSVDERIKSNAELGYAPRPGDNSEVYRLWKKHRGEINPSKHRDFDQAKLIDASEPVGKRIILATFQELNVRVYNPILHSVFYAPIRAWRINPGEAAEQQFNAMPGF